MQLPDTPSILVLLVASDGARWLPEVLEGLRAQAGAIDVLAVDNASADGSAALLEKRFGARRIVALERRVGYGRALAAALKVVGDRAIAADAFLLLHDDVALAPGALDAMVDVLRGDGVGIVGAKLVEWEDPSRLQEIGQSTDRFGRIVAIVERGELDQGQHDGVHDVLYATSAALLVGREVVERLGLFDLRYVALREDLDLCWRARIAGYRTLVTSDATARHAAAGIRELRGAPIKGRARFLGDRNMLATLLKNYGAARLSLALPATLGISLLNVLLFIVRGHRRAALQVLEAIRWNVAHLPSTIRARRRVQRARATGDREITRFMHRGATRLRDRFERAVETVVGAVEEGEEEDLAAPPPHFVDRVRRHPGAALAVLGVAAFLIGARTLWTDAPLAGADMLPFPPRAGDLFEEFASGWRGAGSGGSGPATPGIALLGILAFLSFGSTWLAQRVLVLGLIAVAALSARRLARALGLGPSGRRIAAIAAATSPLLLGAYGSGRLLDLVLVATAPLLLAPLLRAAGVLPAGGWRSGAAGAAGLAAVASLSPWALAFVAGAGAVLAIVRRGALLAVLRRTAFMVGGALVLLLPWSVELFRPGSPLGAGAASGAAAIGDLLGLAAGEPRPVPFALGFGLTAAAVAGLGAMRGTRAALAWLGLAGVVAAWAVARGVPWIAPRASLPLAAAAVAVPVLAGAAFEAGLPALRARVFGLRHLAFGLAGAAFVAQVLVAGAWVAGGRLEGTVAGARLAPAFFTDEARLVGAFRVAWVGDDRGATTVAITWPEGATMRSYLARPAGAGADTLERIAGAAIGGATDAAGRMLATLGVRYVIVRPEVLAPVRDAFARQVDLAFAQRFNGAEVLRNEAWLPVEVAVAAPGWATAGDLDVLGVAERSARASVGGRRQRSGTYRGGTRRGATRRGATTVLLAEDFSPRWHARQGEALGPPQRSFGWATRFAGRRRFEVVIAWGGQGRHRAALGGEALIVAAFGLWWSQRAAREEEPA